MAEKKWVPTVNFNGRLEDLDLAEWIGQAIGAASVCWEDVAKAGMFDSTEASRIAEGLHRHVQEAIDQVIAQTRRAIAENAVAAARKAYQDQKREFFAAAYGAKQSEENGVSVTGRFAVAEAPLMQHVRQETKPTAILVDHVPYRGSNVEAWLKRYRDQFTEEGGEGTRRPMTSPEWGVINDLLDDYREHGDTGTPLSQGVVGEEA